MVLLSTYDASVGPLLLEVRMYGSLSTTHKPCESLVHVCIKETICRVLRK